MRCLCLELWSILLVLPKYVYDDKPSKTYITQSMMILLGLLVPDHPFQVYYKVQQSVITKCDSTFYYKARFSVLTKCDKCYYKVCYYKVRQVLLQSSTIITEHSPPPHRVENLVLRRPILWDPGFQAPDSSLCQWNVGSGFQSLVGLWIPWAVFLNPKPRISYSTSKIFPDSGFYKRNFPRFWNPDSLTWSDLQII